MSSVTARPMGSRYPLEPGTLRLRLLLISGVALLHIIIYYIVTRLTLLRPADAFIHPHLALDDRIPALAWTWPAYWLPYAFVPIAAATSVARMESRPFWRLLLAWSGMIIVGGVIQVAWPAVAPWPAVPALSQRLYHDSVLIMPYATLPSMHVAHVALTAMVAGTVFPSARIRWAGAILVVMVAVATLTLKEHVLLDAISGLTLAVASWHWWQRGSR